MASSSSSSSIFPFAVPVTEKLSRSNHTLWKAQILPTMRGALMMGYLDGTTRAPPKEIEAKQDEKIVKIPNQDYIQWMAKDQQILGYLLASLSREILVHVADKKTAAELWQTIEAMFSSQTRARSINTRIALATTPKGNMSVAEYIGKMKTLADEMASAGKPLEEEELVSYILSGLDMEYNPIVSTLVGRAEPASVGEVYSQLLSFEQRIRLLQGVQGGPLQSSANSAMRGRGGFQHSFQRGRGRGRGIGGRGSNNYTSSRSSYGEDTRPKCQLCKKRGHTVETCWHRFDHDFIPPSEKMAAAATTSYGVDTNWYIDTGATDRITSELDKLTVRDRYGGGDH